jgi:hypothetical protein
VPGNELAMLPEKRIWSHNAGQLLKHLPPEDLAFDSQAPTLVVVEQDSFLSELLSEDSILCQEVLDGVLLTAVDPAGEDQEQQMPWLKLGLHVPPDARFRSGGSGIAGSLSSVPNMAQAVPGKSRCFSHLQFG